MSQQPLFALTKHVRPVRAIPCDICGRKALSSEDRFVHDHCQGKPSPCNCGQPSMAFPDCNTCHGTGRLKDNTICNACPPGPCVSCVSKAMVARVRAERVSARSETEIKSDSLSDS
jgi:hypothetical protein